VTPDGLLRRSLFVAFGRLKVKLWHMKKVLWLMLVLCFFWVPNFIFAQVFQDLNFNSANVSSPDYLQRVPFANAFPGWSSSSSMAYYNASDMDQMTIGVYDKSAGIYSWGPHPVLGPIGYTAYLEGDLSYGVFSGSVGIWQTGVIPANAKSIQFYSTIAYGSALPGYSPTLSLILNGMPVSYSQIGTSGAFTQWAADVSAYAGTATSLEFEVSATYPYSDPLDPHWIFGVGIDNISFSTTPIPEPCTVTLFVFGLLFPTSKLIRKSIS
jgi:hypothetical protein